MEITTVSAEFGGQTLTIETGRMARLAGGAVTVRYGDTVVLGTANRSDPRPGLDFFPLTIEFEERMYAAGKIPGGYIKREGKASENATLSARLTDRPIRPLFPEGYKDDVQVVITVLSADQENDPDILGTIAASAALTISEIPFLGPIGAVRVGLVDDKFILNPTFEQLETSDLDLVVSGTADAIMMVEAGANLINEAKMAEAIEFGHDAIKALISLQEQLRAKVGKAKRVPYIEPGVDSVLTFAEAAANGAAFVVVDTETTGLDAKLSDLVEVAAVKIKGGKITDRWSTLVNAGNPIVGAQMHGITTADLKKGITPKEAAEKFADFAKASPGPLLANMTEFGKTPDITAQRFGELGYHAVIYPLSMMRLAMGEVARGLAALRRDGSVRESLPRMQTRKELYSLLGYVPGEQWNFPNDR